MKSTADKKMNNIAEFSSIFRKLKPKSQKQALFIIKSLKFAEEISNQETQQQK